MPDHRFCVAPMMDWTDRHDRVFLRQFSRHALLYTEMISSAALMLGDADYLLQHHRSEHPVALQLGGSDPEQLREAAVMGAQAGFAEINLNVGCPSDRVQAAAFGACLMAAPALVRRCVAAIKSAVDIEVTVKCRIGIDQQDSADFLLHFVEQIMAGGCETVIIHARKAILQGLTPKQNREIPPLNYQRVHHVKARFPELNTVINGGITSLEQAEDLLHQLDGVMLGRAAYQNPYLLHQVDTRLFGEPAVTRSRADYLTGYLPYVASELEKGTPLQHMSRHLLGLFKGQKGGRQFRRHLSENSHRQDAGIKLLEDALACVV